MYKQRAQGQVSPLFAFPDDAPEARRAGIFPGRGFLEVHGPPHAVMHKSRDVLSRRHVIAASRVSSDSTRHQCGSKSAPMGQTFFS